MLTRSAKKRSNAYDCKEITPLSSGNKKKSKSLIKSTGGTRSPTSACGNENKNIQSPVINIHVYMPSMTNNANNSSPCQPTIHLHFHELVNNLSSGAILNNVRAVDETEKVESPSQIHYNFEAQNNSYNSMVANLPVQEKVRKKLDFGQFKENNKSVETESVLSSVEKNKKNEDSLINSPYKGQPRINTRRNIHQAKNRKLLKNLKDLSVNKSIATKIKNKKSFKNVKNKKTSNSLGNNYCLKEAVVVLHDIKEIMKEENIKFYEVMLDDEKTVSVNSTNTKESSEKIDQNSYDFPVGNDNEQNLTADENNKQDLTNNTNIQNEVSVNNKFQDNSPAYLSDNEASTLNDSETSILDKSVFSEDLKQEHFVLDREKSHRISKKDICKAAFDNKNDCKETTKNNQVNNCELLESEICEITALTENSIPNSCIEEIDKTVMSSTSISMEYCYKSVTTSCSEDFDCNFEIPDTTDSCQEDVDGVSFRELDTDNVNGMLESKDENLFKNIEENKLLTESDDYKEINTPGFQLELIKKEMKKRNMNVEKVAQRETSSKKKGAFQVSKKLLENSPSANKTKRLKKTAVKTSSEKNVNKVSLAENYIPLQVSGQTKFAVAQISKIKPYNGHSAKSFKEEMLFGKRVIRNKDSKDLQVLRFKKQAAAKRNKKDLFHHSL